MAEGERYDVIVVGAGPAGSMAAYHAVRGGCKTALLERKEVVGLPVRCGEAVGFKGFSKSCTIEDQWVLSKVKRITMVSPAGHTVSLVHTKKIGDNYVLDRRIMDKDLADRAIQAGVDFFPATPVRSVSFDGHATYTCMSDDTVFTAQSIICADGVESRLARDLGWDTALSLDDVESCALCVVEHEKIEDGVITFHLGTAIAPGGFVWVFPRGGHAANVGLGILGKYSTPGKAKQLLETFVNRVYPRGTVTRLHYGGVPVGRWLRPLVRNGAIVVGDAARQVSSLTGGGIAYSLFAGKTAGQTVAEAKKGDTINYALLDKYQKCWAAYCGKQQERSYALKSMLLENNNDTFFDTIAESLRKEKPETLSYMRVFMRTFARHPRILLKTFFLFR